MTTVEPEPSIYITTYPCAPPSPAPVEINTDKQRQTDLHKQMTINLQQQNHPTATPIIISTHEQGNNS